MKKFLPLLLIPVLFLGACTSTPQIYPTLPPQAFASPVPTQPPCSEVSTEPTPIPGVDSRFPAVRAGEWTKGPTDAAVTIIVYNEFQCLECNDHVLSVLAETHPEDVRVVYRQFPQPDLYDKGLLAAQAAEAAGAQDRFWDMHDILFAKQSEWVYLTPEEFTPWVINEAERFGMDRARFEAALNDAATLSKVQKAIEDGKQAGIPVLPIVLINGQIYTGPTDYSAFDQVVRLIALGKKQSATCPEMTIDPGRQYIATLKTKYGNIVIELYADKAPIAVNSFVFLARRGWYDGVTFHRVIPGFVAQTGDPSGTGLGGPGYIFRNEIDPSLYFDKPGMVGMANSGADTNGSQFFITFAAAPHLDGLYTIFGHVLSGMDVLAKITPRDPGTSAILPDGDILISVTIEER
jgi:cyclophilin family peptidyl-prolyl cis-trans isomerase